MALSGDTALVGAPSKGAAYVFTRSGTSWGQQAELSASDAAAFDFFGVSVALSGDTALVGAYGKTVGDQDDAGAAYVFTRSGTSWSQQAELSDPDAAVRGDNFGYSVALSGDTALVGAPYRTVDAQESTGAAYVYLLSSAPIDRPPQLAATAGSVTVEEGQTATNSGTWSDPDDDPVSLTASVGTVVKDPDGSWSWSYATSDGPAQSQTVAITADDGKGGVTTTTFGLVVENVAPTVSAIYGPTGPVTTGSQTSWSASFGDPGGIDTHTALWDWGDGTTSAGTVSESQGSGSVAGLHTYAAVGAYAVTLTVTDKDGGFGTASAQCVVSPTAGGWAAGKGWINSPVGAYPAKPSLKGKASFAFFAKSKAKVKGQIAHTRFHFCAANLSFDSTSCESLTIASAKIIYTGAGKLGRKSGYGYLVSAIDGKAAGAGKKSTFRIKIWNTATSSVVYDSQMGAANNADPSTVLAGGTIIVHRHARHGCH